ncbi:helix-turn-helix domain-containing protein [Streptomyces sp. NPDC047453]|uniref:helix-turn-helix domain-containing protein n=1 Tax=Streptomyces sp. NPDC047453 TaxID=3154812 RepID=UPI0033F236B4
MRYAQGGGLTAERRAFRERIRLAAAEQFAAGVKTAVVAKELRVSERSVERWRRAWREGGTQALRLSDAQVAVLEKELGKGPAGQAHYEKHVRCYAELWPDVDAPIPNELSEDAHASLDDHKVRKPRGLLARPAFLLLAAIVRADIDNQLWIRKEWSAVWQNFGRTPPKELAALPSGITNTQARTVTRSATAPTKLLEHRGGPLAAETEVAQWLYPYRDSDRPSGLKVLHLTDAGRAHYATHLEWYRTAYDDVDAPEEWHALPASQ